MQAESTRYLFQSKMQKRLKPFLFSLGLVFALFQTISPGTSYAGGQIHHELKVVLSPESNQLSVEDRLTLPSTLLPDQTGKFHFSLHGGLSPQPVTAGVIIEPLAEPPEKESALRLPERVLAQGAPVSHYTMTLPIGLSVVTLRYQGKINHPLIDSGDGVGASTGEKTSAGIISAEGIFLSGETFWYPYFHNNLMTFSLDIKLPQGWSAVSQGERKENLSVGQSRHIRWESPEPQEEIYLVAGEWTEYQRDTGRVLAMAFLRTPDAALAERYLKATEQYLEMYQKLLGPYPYKKFALVENFWETGYGMPSFTLLGSKVLRLPFILHTSYPHEILHNWWGNGVYVKQDQGNWSEGLTSYLADYLLQEQQGNGEASRRASLQRYANTVSASNDFPLAAFQSRYDVASQSIGYGKTMFLLHMFRRKLGNDTFIKALRTFFHENRFERASFSDLGRVFSRAAKKDLSHEFMQWVNRTGAPVLRVTQVKSTRTEEGYQLTAIIQQQQPGPAYLLDIPIAITLHGREEAYQTTLKMTEKELAMTLTLPLRPIRLKIDPEYDLFRRLHHSEIPHSLSKAFAAESTLILLPSTASASLRREYKKLAGLMQQDQPERISIGWDTEYKKLPKDRSIWLFGWENRFQRNILKRLRGLGLSSNSAMIRIGDIQIPRRGHSLVFTTRHPDHPKQSLSWLASDRAKAIVGLGRKLPHYGSSGYLGFKGNHLKNIAKGKWPVVRSPMSIRVKQGDGKWIKEEPAILATREALASLSPLFSRERMRQDLAFLADSKMKGRGFGTPELDRAAEHIASEFRKAGLKPAGTSGRSFLQQWKERGSGVGSEVTLKNVVGILPGETPGLSNEVIVVGAHYDHLGFGWPRVHDGDEGKLHPGANTNASGVALLLELARLLKKDKALKRPVLFVAFTGKEVGLRGSEHLVSALKSSPSRRITGMLNLDTIGRLSQNRLFILGTGSSREWAPILRRAGVATGLQIASFPGIFGSSDHLSFINAGIPAIQFYSGVTPENDRPSDSFNKINFPGITAIGRVVKVVIENLANRPTPLSSAPARQASPSLIWQRRNR